MVTVFELFGNPNSIAFFHLSVDYWLVISWIVNPPYR